MKKKKLFAIIMSVLLVACFMPSMAFADPPAAPVVAKIGSTEYTDLHTALEAAKDGGTVVLQSDITLTSEWVPVARSNDKNGKDLGFRGILDGNDKTISGLSITQGTSNIGLFTKLGENRRKQHPNFPK